MTYLKATEAGYLDAEKSITGAGKEIVTAYKGALEEIQSLLEKQYAKLAGVEAQDYYKEMLKYDRLKALEDQIKIAYKAAADKAGRTIKKSLTTAMTENYYRQSYLASWAVPYTPPPINPDLVEYAVTGNIKKWVAIQKKYKSPIPYTPQFGTLADLLNKNYLAGLDKVLRTVENGLITGKGYAKQAKAIKEVLESSTYNAVRVARTEGQRVLNAAAILNAENLENSGFAVQKEWLASLDGKTRPSHRALDGQRITGVGEPFVSPVTGARGLAPGQMSQAGDNINCRCTTMTIIDGESPVTRVAINPVTKEREVISFTSYSDWIKQY